MPWNSTKGKLLIAEKCLETLSLNTVPKRAAFPNPNPNCRLSPRQGPQSWLRQNSSPSTELSAVSACSLPFALANPAQPFPAPFSLPFKPNPFTLAHSWAFKKSLSYCPDEKSSESSMSRSMCLSSRVKAAVLPGSGSHVSPCIASFSGV